MHHMVLMAMIAMHVDATGLSRSPVSTCEFEIIFSIGFVLCHSKSLCQQKIECLRYENAKSSALTFQTMYSCNVKKKKTWHEALE